MTRTIIHPSPLITIALNDKTNTIRVPDLSSSLKSQIWQELSPKQRNNNRFKRYFFYKLDNPPLNVILKILPLIEKQIHYIKGHGSSKRVKIPKEIDTDLAYLLGALRDGGIHHDKKNQAYKIHFSQKERTYLEAEIVPKLSRLFEIKGKISLRKDKVFQLQLASKPLYLFFAKVFDMTEIQQYWATPKFLEKLPKSLLKEYIRGFHDAEGSTDHLYHSWHTPHECPPLQFITTILTTQFKIRATKPLLMKTNKLFNRYPAYQIFIHDYTKFEAEILRRK